MLCYSLNLVLVYSDRWYPFESSKSWTSTTSQVLMFITERDYEALDKYGEAKAVALYISTGFGKVWYINTLSKAFAS